MRRESEWLIMGCSLVLFAFTTQAHHLSASEASVVIDLRRPNYSVILRIDQAPVVLSSLPAADERSLFGIETKAAVVTPVEPSVVEPPVTAAAPLKRYAALKTARPKRAVQRVLPGPSLTEAVEVPVASEKADLAVMELAAPPRRSSTVAVAESEVQMPERPSLGFNLGERTSLRVGPMSSMVPDYRAESAHGDVQERWRLHDERDASQGAGAAVGMTFKLN